MRAAPLYYLALIALPFAADVARADAQALPEHPEVSRREIVSLTPGALGTAAPVAIDLFGEEIVVEPTSTETTHAGQGVWVGSVRDRAGSLAVFVTSGARVTGYLELDGKTFELHPRADGSHELDEVDLSKLPDELPPLEPRRRPPADDCGASRTPSSPRATADDGIDVVRVLVVYTAAAAAELVDPASAIQLAMTLTNIAFANSQVRAAVELAGTSEVSFDESEAWMGTQLVQLTQPDDGVLDEVHTLRDELDADVVMLVSESRGACGISNLLLDRSIDAAADAFSITHFSCMNAGYTFTHELGHTLGAGHDRAAGCTGLFPYSCGYRNEGVTGWRTLMAYPCAGIGCPRILNFSNPEVSFLGEPTGLSGDSSVATDNARTITLAAPTVASFRGASLVPLGVAATHDLSDAVRVDWFAPALPVDGYQVERFDRWSDRAASKTWSVSSSSFSDDTAELGVEYYYRVAAYTPDRVQGPASSLVRGLRRSADCGDGDVDSNGEQCDGGTCCSDDCLIEPAAICGRPVTGWLDATCGGGDPTAVDCLFIFNSAAGLERCEPACLCDVNTTTQPGITATDALVCLGAVVGGHAALDCSCD